MSVPATAHHGRQEPGGPARGAGEPHGVPVLASKFLPPLLGAAPVARPRLLGLVSRGVSRTPVTLISGPAGSGKTVLAAAWLQGQPEGKAIAWLTLDETDDDPATFWTYVTAALSRVGVAFPDVDPPTPGERLPRSFVSRVASDLLAQPRPVVLVVDNADCLTSPEVVDTLDLLVRHAGRRLRLVLCARADPLLPLHQYRLADTLTEIRGDQLAFTREETRQLLGHLGAPLTPEVADALQAGTGGWAVGLRLAAAPLKQGVPPEELIASLAQEDGSVAQYVFAEVLKDQPASVRRFLLRISVTSELWPELVDRLGGGRNGRRILAGLARANAFVEQSAGAPGGYRIHPLFREMLRAQLAYDHPREVAGLHRVCAAWYADAGRSAEAVAHAIAARDWHLASSLLIEDLVVARLLTHDIDASLRALDALPATLPGPESAVIRVAEALGRCRPPDHGDLAQAAAVASDEAAGLSLRVSAAVCCAAVIALGIPAGEQVQDAGGFADRLLAELPDAHRREGRELSGVLASARAAAAVGSDAPDGALLAVLRAALAAASTVGSARLRCRALGALALVEALQGHLNRAGELAQEAETLGESGAVPRAERPASAAAAAAWVCLERYEHADARRWMLRAQESGESGFTTPLLAVLQSRLLRLRHEFDAAEQCLAAHVDGDRRLPRWVREQVVDEAVRVRLARGEAGQGLRLLDRLDAGAPRAAVLRGMAGLLGAPAGDRTPPAVGDGLPPALAVEGEIVASSLQVEAGHGASAVAALGRALELAAPERLRWPFFDAPPQVRRLLRTQPQLGPAGSWLSPSSDAGRGSARTAGASATAPPEPAPAVTQELSERELEVLRHLAEMLSTAEIAGTMFVSVNTVRTHIRSILRKLSVSRRNQAVRRGRELGII